MIDIIRREGSMTQTNLKKLINLHGSTASYLVNDLKKFGILIDSGKIIQTTGPGKPGNLLKLNNNFAQFIGCYVEKDKVNVYIIGLDGETLNHKRISIREHTHMEETLIEIIDILCKENTDIHGIGIALKGMVLLNDTIRIKYGEEIYETWKLEGLQQRLKERFWEIPVVIENDANCSAFLYQHDEKENEMDLLLYLLNKVPFGIGCSILVKGQILKGANGAAGQFFRKGANLKSTFKDIKDENKYLENFIEAILPHIATVTYLLDPQRVILSGSMLNDVLPSTIERINTSIRKYGLPSEVILTKGNQDLGPAKGAALIAMNDYISDFIGKVGVR